VAWSVLQGLIFLHQRKVIHGEIKSENILYNKQGQIKLIDGTSTTQPDNPSIFHLAPEVLRETTCDASADVWSLGIMCIELANKMQG